MRRFGFIHPVGDGHFQYQLHGMTTALRGGAEYIGDHIAKPVLQSGIADAVTSLIELNSVVFLGSVRHGSGQTLVIPRNSKVLS